MKRSLLLLLIPTLALPLAAGCSKSGDDYDPNKIAVKQPGSGPPPMNKPGEPAKGP